MSRWLSFDFEVQVVVDSVFGQIGFKFGSR